MFILAIALGITVNLSQRTQETRRKAAENFSGDLVQFSYNIRKVWQVEGSQYWTYYVDLYADTGSQEKTISKINATLAYSASMSLFVKDFDTGDCKGTLRNVGWREGNTRKVDLDIDCGNKGGKLKVATLELYQNIFVPMTYLMLFDGHIANVYSNNSILYRARWVSGYSGAVDLDGEYTANPTVTPGQSGEYKCYEKTKPRGARFMTDLVCENGGEKCPSFDVGTTFWLDVSADSVGKKVIGLDLTFSYPGENIELLDVLKLDGLNDEYKISFSVDRENRFGKGYIAVYLVDASVNNESIVPFETGQSLMRMIFKVKKEFLNRWAIRYLCTPGSMADSNILNYENGMLQDLISCEDNQMFFRTDSGNLLLGNGYIWLNEPKDGYKEMEYESVCNREFKPGYECWEDKQGGDYNGDYTVNGSDYIVWRREFVDKIVEGGPKSDGGCDGKVSMADYSLWREMYLK